MKIFYMQNKSLYSQLKVIANKNRISIFERTIEYINKNDINEKVYACGLYIFLKNKTINEQINLSRKAKILNKQAKTVDDEIELTFPRILIDENKNEREKGLILLHELGHHFAVLNDGDYSDESANKMKDYILGLI